MPLPGPSLEPAVRDPKKLRNTAFVLVGIMFLGGWLVLKAYESWSVGQAKDDRPAVVYRITPERDLRMLRQDGKVANLVDLRNNVVAINVISLRDPEAAQRSMGVMKRLSESRVATADLKLMTLMIDPVPSEKLLPVLSETAVAHGMKLPQWWLGSNEPKTLHKFIKNELKANVYPNEIGGKWAYDPSIVLIDRNGHIRRAVVTKTKNGKPFQPAVVGFDFDQAAEWDKAGQQSGTDRSNVEQLEILLNQTIDKLLAEPFIN